MIAALFNFPTQTKVGRLVAKSKIYQHGPVNGALKAQFVAQVEQIIWQYKLAPETTNLPARLDVAEIQVFDITLKATELDDEVLQAIDRAIPFPIIFRLLRDQQIRMVAAYKRPCEADGDKRVIGDYFFGPWLSSDTESAQLPVALDLHGLYEQLLRALLPGPARAGESLPSQLERLNRLRVRQNDYRNLERKLRKERQFNRKVAINADIRVIKAEVDELKK